MTVETLLRAVRKPPKVVLFRGVQEIRLRMMGFRNGWKRLEQSVRRWWSDDRIRAYAVAKGSRPAILSPTAVRALSSLPKSRIAEIIVYAERVRRRDFNLLGAAAPKESPLPWHTDWRWNHTWEPAYFREYRFYGEHKKVPFDVKVPWELSRMDYVLPLLQAAVIDDSDEWLACALSIVADWETRNPVAHSVNWYPMEASMRGIILVFALEMLLATGKPDADTLAPLLRLIALHGEFLWRNVEYTDIRGNHYAANLTALLLFGLVLREHYPRSARWLKYAKSAIPNEIRAQFLADGVQFEKSVPYHRLVTELFLVAALALERDGDPLEPRSRERLRAACRYSALYTRPDGLTPNVGDNDDGRILVFDPVCHRDHCTLTGLAAVYFADGTLKCPSDAPLSVFWFLGTGGVEQWNALEPCPTEGLVHLKDGGVVLVRGGQNYLWADVGEVGMKGRGGHGHNDLLSFELVLDGVPVIVDPGSFVYTGDAKARDYFRSTESHNTVRVDGAEMARFAGMWTIRDDAEPEGVEVREENDEIVICAGHGGYRRLADPVTVRRKIRFDAKLGTFRCVDSLDCRDAHRIERFLHFYPNIEILLVGDHAVFSTGARRWVVRWDARTDAHVTDGWVSPGYGVKTKGPIVALTDEVKGADALSFTILPE